MAGFKTRLLARADIAQTMRLIDYIEAVEGAFRALGEGEMIVPAVVHLAARDGAFHVKSASFSGSPPYVAVKVNGNFPQNSARHGLPTIQGAIVLCDTRDGSLLAIMDSIEVTAMRTAAATAVAAKYLAHKAATVATVIGCGIQGAAQLLALCEVLPLQKVFAFDLNKQRSVDFAQRMAARTGLSIDAVDNFETAVLDSQVVVTCTSSRRAYLRAEHVRPGTFIAAVGADNHDKQELDPTLLSQSKVIADRIEQCAEIGDLHHAIAAGLMTRSNVVAELSAIVCGSVMPDFAPEDVIVFDSTGLAIQDVAAAGLIYERAVAAGIGTLMEFG
jgi:alanine dehydrogenase